jgi:K+-sensing histidine kinase KdpD
MSTVSELDPRVGSHWLPSADADTRLQLLTGLLSRFNHDLRTPLNTIMGWTHLLQQGAVDSTRGKHVADVIARNSREQTVLLEDFVDDGRAVLGVLKPESAAVRVDESVGAALERVQPVLTLHAVSLRTDLKVGDAEVVGDAKRLQRLLYRLLVVVARRARENSAVDVAAKLTPAAFMFSISAAADDDGWSDAALLDLRISSFYAALHRATLEVADATRASLKLTIPLAR